MFLLTSSISVVLGIVSKFAGGNYLHVLKGDSLIAAGYLLALGSGSSDAL